LGGEQRGAPATPAVLQDRAHFLEERRGGDVATAEPLAVGEVADEQPRGRGRLERRKGRDAELDVPLDARLQRVRARELDIARLDVEGEHQRSVVEGALRARVVL